MKLKRLFHPQLFRNLLNRCIEFYKYIILVLYTICGIDLKLFNDEKNRINRDSISF